jgi:hypothetical protein
VTGGVDRNMFFEKGNLVQPSSGKKVLRFESSSVRQVNEIVSGIKCTKKEQWDFSVIINRVPHGAGLL